MFPISDMIENIHGDKGEAIGFQINPKMARLMFIKSLHDECHLRDIIHYALTLNRVFCSDLSMKITNINQQD